MGVYDIPHAPVSDAPWPVVNARPTFGAIFRNLRFSDYTLFVGMTAVGAAYGFAAGTQTRQHLLLSSGGPRAAGRRAGSSPKIMHALVPTPRSRPRSCAAQASRCGGRASTTWARLPP